MARRPDLRTVAQTRTAAGATRALAHGEVRRDARPVVALIGSCALADAFGDLLCGCAARRDGALARIAAAGAGVVVQFDPRTPPERLCGRDVVPDPRVVATLLRLIGVRALRLDDDPHGLATALGDLGLDVREPVPA